jgi:hypothetical protein
VIGAETAQEVRRVGTPWHLDRGKYLEFLAAKAGIRVAFPPNVVNSKQLLRDALVGFVLGLVVMSGVALVTWQTRAPAAQIR